MRTIKPFDWEKLMEEFRENGWTIVDNKAIKKTWPEDQGHDSEQ